VDCSLIFPIELISNFIRPFSLGFVCLAICLPTRSYGHGLAPGAGENLLAGPGRVDALSVFVAFIQTFVFILLSQLYLSEVSHAPHDSHSHDNHAEDDGMGFIAPGLNLIWLYHASLSDAANALAHVEAQTWLRAEKDPAVKYSLLLSVLLERRCKRGGGYRMRAKSFRCSVSASSLVVREN